MIDTLCRRSTRAAAFSTALALLAALVGLWMAAPLPIVRAASGGNITFTPTSGPAGTSIQVEIRLHPATSTPYTLSVTTSSPTAGGCTSARPIPGIGPVSVDPQGGFVTITWPASLAAGQYWFCAAPQSGSGDMAQSADPFTVTVGPAPTATAVPLRTATVSVLTPAGSISAGEIVSLSITDWVNASPPSFVELVSQSGDQTFDMVVTAPPVNGSGAYTLNVTLPKSIPPGTYTLLVKGIGIQGQSAPFIVAAPAATPTPAALGTSTSGSGTALPLIIAAGVGLLLIIALGLLLAKRRR